MPDEKAIKSIELLQQWRQEARYKQYEETWKNNFIRACGKVAQLPDNLGMVWSYDSKKGMTVSTNIGITMQENMNGHEFSFSNFKYKDVSINKTCNDVDTFLKILKEIVEQNS